MRAHHSVFGANATRGPREDAGELRGRLLPRESAGGETRRSAARLSGSVPDGGLGWGASLEEDRPWASRPVVRASPAPGRARGFGGIRLGEAAAGRAGRAGCRGAAAGAPARVSRGAWGAAAPASRGQVCGPASPARGGGWRGPLLAPPAAQPPGRAGGPRCGESRRPRLGAVAAAPSRPTRRFPRNPRPQRRCRRRPGRAARGASDAPAFGVTPDSRAPRKPRRARDPRTRFARRFARGAGAAAGEARFRAVRKPSACARAPRVAGPVSRLGL